MGVGSRVINYLVDTILVYLIGYGFYKWHQFYVQFWSYKYVPFYFFFFGSMFAYYFIFETLTGRTIGKMVTFTRVRTLQNKRPNVLQTFIRSLLRLTIIDPFFIPWLDRPLHDALSKTRVVEITK